MMFAVFSCRNYLSCCCITAARCICETLHCLKKASVETWIPFYCLQCIKQLVEDFDRQITKILRNKIIYQKPLNFFFALLICNCKSTEYSFTNLYFLHLKETLLLTFSKFHPSISRFPVYTVSLPPLAFN